MAAITRKQAEVHRQERKESLARQGALIKCPNAFFNKVLQELFSTNDGCPKRHYELRLPVTGLPQIRGLPLKRRHAASARAPVSSFGRSKGEIQTQLQRRIRHAGTTPLAWSHLQLAEKN